MEKKEKPETESFLGSLTDTIINGLKPRIEDPFIGVYTVSFLVWNYQIFVFLFSGLDPILKYQNIQRSFNILSFTVPLLSVIVVNFILPKYLRKYYTQSEQFKIQLNNELNAVRKEAVTLDAIVAKYKDQIEDLENKNDANLSKVKDAEYKYNSLLAESAKKYDKEKEQLRKEHNEQLILWEKRYSELISNLEEERSKTKHLEDILRHYKNSDTISEDEIAKEKLNELKTFLIRNSLDESFKELFSKVLTSGKYYSGYAPSKDLAIFLTKDLFSLTPSSDLSGETNYITTNELGRNVFNLLIDSSV